MITLMVFGREILIDNRDRSNMLNHDVRSIPEIYNALEQLEHEMLVQLRACTDNDNDPGIVCDTELLATYNSISHALSEARMRVASAWYHGIGKGERL